MIGVGVPVAFPLLGRGDVHDERDVTQVAVSAFQLEPEAAVPPCFTRGHVRKGVERDADVVNARAFPLPGVVRSARGEVRVG